MSSTDQPLFESIDQDARLTSIPLPHALVGAPENVKRSESAQRRNRAMIDAGQCELELLPEPTQGSLL